MGHDPAFLFYFQDFAWGTRRFTLEEKGLYIELLCEQADSKTGAISEKDMLNICKTYDINMNNIVFTKFERNGFGYYNNTLKEIMQKRKEYSESRRQNRLSKPEKDDNISKTYDKHMEDVNEIENKDEDVIRNKNKSIIGNIIVKEIIEDLNKVMTSNYKDTTKGTIALINTRLKDGFTFEDFKIVHRNMYDSWGSDIKMVKFLRPETLYGNKFESYLNQKVVNTLLSDVTRFNIEAGKNFLERGDNEA